MKDSSGSSPPDAAARASAFYGRIGIQVIQQDPERHDQEMAETHALAYFVAKAKHNAGQGGNAFGIIEAHLDDAQQRLPLVYPVTTEKLAAPLSYEDVIADFYDTCAEQIAQLLDAGQDVAVICEGDPFFYGSFMHIFLRLRERLPCEVVPGVPAMLAGAGRSTGSKRLALIGAPPSSGRPSGSTTRPSNASPTGTRTTSPEPVTVSPASTSVASSSSTQPIRSRSSVWTNPVWPRAK